MNQIHISKCSYIPLLFVLVACQTPPAPPARTSVLPTAAPISPSAQALTTFSSKEFKIPMSVSFGPNLHITDNYDDYFTVETVKDGWELSFNLVTKAKVDDPKSVTKIPFPEDFAAWIKANPDFKVDQSKDVMVGGIKGQQIDVTPSTAKFKRFLYLNQVTWNIVTSPERWRFIMLNNVNGERLLILMIVQPDKFNDVDKESQPVLDSVKFTDR